MKILQVIHDFLPRHQAGSELYCYHLSKGLMARGHEVRLFYSEINHEQPQYTLNRGEYDSLPYVEIINNHAYHAFEDTYNNPSVEKLFAQHLDEYKPEVVHFHHLLNLSFGCVHECKKRGISVVFTLHDYWLTCPRGGGQRFRGEGKLCFDVDPNLCAECISRYTFPGGRAVRLLKRFLRLFESVDDPTLLPAMQRGRIITPQSHFVTRGVCVVNGDSRQVLFAHPPSSIALRLDLPENAALAFAVAMDPSTYERGGDGVRFRITCEGQTVYDRFLDAKNNLADRGWHSERIALDCHAGKKRELIFETVAEPNGSIDFCSACWAEPKLIHTQAKPYEPSATGKAQAWGESALTALQRRSLRDKVNRRTESVKDVFADVDLFIAPSPFLRTQFIEFGLPEEKIVFSDYGIAPLEYSTTPRQPQWPIRFTYVGTLVEHKGLHVLIDAFNRLPHGQATLDVYGSMDEFTGYVSRVQSMIAHPGITLRGRAENSDIPRILANTDALVIPSIWFENSPITIHEAFLARVPVITSRLGGMADLVRHEQNGLLFEVGNAEDLSRCLLRCVENPTYLNQIRPNPDEVKSLEDDAIWMEERYGELRAGK